MNSDDLAGRLAFLRESERLKDTLRSGFTSEGARESSAEHSWRTCLFALAFADQLEGIDMVRLLSLLIIHDLGEVYGGDVPAIFQLDNDGRDAREREDFHALTEPLPAPLRTQMRALFEEYAGGETADAKLAKGFDKLETLLQHTQGANPADFDYEFNLGYGARWTGDDALLQTIRQVIDAATRRRADGAPGWDKAG
ncbi:MAG: HD domain-containing protein [Pseudomonadota bacterium]